MDKIDKTKITYNIAFGLSILAILVFNLAITKEAGAYYDDYYSYSFGMYDSYYNDYYPIYEGYYPYSNYYYSNYGYSSTHFIFGPNEPVFGTGSYRGGSAGGVNTSGLNEPVFGTGSYRGGNAGGVNISGPNEPVFSSWGRR